ncbi:phosphoglycerate kinase [Acidiplasma cupricumulans]|uniref:Phosphoglycerate kinase n=1 Tax=Acidiplasma cupricumulans TaxID=312540 RepID=A0A0Q0XJB7_9ARCH|nr:phosphoglycerate kinase [Acidiplasma cupricumulans]KQB34979.1 phosphoglycerate kinase [Acidiplasma cupricumulans]
MNNYPFFTMDDFDFDNKCVYLRIDINSPINPITQEIMDDSRLNSYSETINELSDSKLVITAHQGRPGDDDFTSLKYHSRYLSKLMGREILFIDSLFGSSVDYAVSRMKKGDIIMLENTRFYSEEVSINFNNFNIIENTHIVKNLSKLFDYYIIDAFGAVHRPHTSLIGFKKSGPMIAGRLMEREISMLDKFKYSNQRPKIAILGGSKVSDAVKVSRSFFEKGIVDYILYGGVAANLFLIASGKNIGKRNIDFIKNNNKNYLELIDMARNLIEKYPEKIILPDDFILNPSQKNITLKDNVPDNELLADIGFNSIEKFKDYIKRAKNIFINGPMGMYEINEYSIGTREILDEISNSSAMKIVGGGHTISAVNRFGFRKYMDYVSTGGGALINYLSGDSIPVIDALIENKKMFGD